MSETSASLLERLKDNPDGDSWVRFDRIYRPLIRRWLNCLATDLQPADLDEVVQNVMLFLLQKIGAFENRRGVGSFRKWLRGVVVNRLREIKRIPGGVGGSEFHQQLDQLANNDSQLSRLWDEEHDKHVAAQFRKIILNEFSETNRRAFDLFVMQGNSAKEAAAKLGISEAAVWTAKSRILKRLRREADNILD